MLSGSDFVTTPPSIAGVEFCKIYRKDASDTPAEEDFETSTADVERSLSANLRHKDQKNDSARQINSAPHALEKKKLTQAANAAALTSSPC